MYPSGLKLYTKTPNNGLVIYCGTVLTDDGKEKKVNIDFEPFKAINTSLYLCDNKFHTEAMKELLESDDKFGFIVMDGNGALFGTVQGNTREVCFLLFFTRDTFQLCPFHIPLAAGKWSSLLYVQVLHRFQVDLPKKHGRGGQSALRFARLRMEKRHNYVRKVAEVAVTMFITNDKVGFEGCVTFCSVEREAYLLHISHRATKLCMNM